MAVPLHGPSGGYPQPSHRRRDRFRRFCSAHLCRLPICIKALKNLAKSPLSYDTARNSHDAFKAHDNLKSRAAAAALNVRIQALPQELKDEILRFTLLATLQPKQKIIQAPGKPFYILSIDPPHSTMHEYVDSNELWSPASKVRVLLIDERYKVPVALQIDRKTRKSMSDIFYLNTVFIAPGQGLMWFRSIPKEYWKKVQAHLTFYLGDLRFEWE
jgi:hypothetical protein